MKSAPAGFARKDNGLWRSLVAHLTGGQGVAGSNPVSPTKKSRKLNGFRDFSRLESYDLVIISYRGIAGYSAPPPGWIWRVQVAARCCRSACPPPWNAHTSQPPAHRMGGPLRSLPLSSHRAGGGLELWLSVGEVAAYLGVSVSTLYDWRTRHLCPRACIEHQSPGSRW